MKVAVLKGGRSLERQVSLRSAARVEDALTSLGHQVVSLDAGADLVRRLKEEGPEVAFIALHGPGGEDGTPQELLEILGIPYTGPGVTACIRCMDKVLAKHLLRAAGIPTPDWVAFNATAFRELGAADALEEIEARLGFPLVVKPGAQGSALGVRFAASRDDVPEALVAAFSYDDRVMLERHVAGPELAVSLLDGDGRTEYVCPAELAPAETAAVQGVATRAYEALGCTGFARVDLMLDADAAAQVLEANAIPGLTDTSLFPMAANAAGISFEDLVARIVDLARARGPVASATLPG
ncbi:MAG: D-alanine--D-alanine ligase [Actinobacteria bacterium]|nr:MAG: D-alanine--D-alanine ligase [Actinomycetota bacterium]